MVRERQNKYEEIREETRERRDENINNDARRSWKLN